MKQQRKKGGNDSKDSTDGSSEDDGSDDNDDGDDDPNYDGKGDEEQEPKLTPYVSKQSPFAKPHIVGDERRLYSYNVLYLNYRPRGRRQTNRWAALLCAYCMQLTCNIHTNHMYATCDSHATHMTVHTTHNRY